MAIGLSILEQEDALKGLPTEALQQMMRQPSPNAPPFLVAAELKRREQMAKEFAGKQAEAQMGQNAPTVAHRLAGMQRPMPMSQAGAMAAPPPQAPMPRESQIAMALSGATGQPPPELPTVNAARGMSGAAVQELVKAMRRGGTRTASQMPGHQGFYSERRPAPAPNDGGLAALIAAIIKQRSEPERAYGGFDVSEDVKFPQGRSGARAPARPVTAANGTQGRTVYAQNGSPDLPPPDPEQAAWFREEFVRGQLADAKRRAYVNEVGRNLLEVAPDPPVATTRRRIPPAAYHLVVPPSRAEVERGELADAERRAYLSVDEGAPTGRQEPPGRQKPERERLALRRHGEPTERQKEVHIWETERRKRREERRKEWFKQAELLPEEIADLKRVIRDDKTGSLAAQFEKDPSKFLQAYYSVDEGAPTGLATAPYDAWSENVPKEVKGVKPPYDAFHPEDGQRVVDLPEAVAKNPGNLKLASLGSGQVAKISGVINGDAPPSVGGEIVDIRAIFQKSLDQLSEGSRKAYEDMDAKLKEVSELNKTDFGKLDESFKALDVFQKTGKLPERMRESRITNLLLEMAKGFLGNPTMYEGFKAGIAGFQAVDAKDRKQYAEGLSAMLTANQALLSAKVTMRNGELKERQALLLGRRAESVGNIRLATEQMKVASQENERVRTARFRMETARTSRINANANLFNATTTTLQKNINALATSDLRRIRAAIQRGKTDPQYRATDEYKSAVNELGTNFIVDSDGTAYPNAVLYGKKVQDITKTPSPFQAEASQIRFDSQKAGFIRDIDRALAPLLEGRAATDQELWKAIAASAKIPLPKDGRIGAQWFKDNNAALRKAARLYIGRRMAGPVGYTGRMKQWLEDRGYIGRQGGAVQGENRDPAGVRSRITDAAG